MATAMYLEHYLDSIENLPFELQRNFSLMRDLDQRSQDLRGEIEKMAEDYVSDVKGLSPEKRVERLKNIQTAFNKSKEFGDDKVQLAMQTYEMVDKHIRKLDADLARFEAELKNKTVDSPTADPGPSGKSNKRGKKQDKSTSKKGSQKKGRLSDDETPKLNKKKQKTSHTKVEAAQPVILPSLPVAFTHPSDVLDMPVDPNEPTYCLCHQVSYGEMIGCDNPDCPIEWFHFGCVGLTTKPKGKWFCPKCTLERKKK
ncbi:PREDICTED: inhibitor of growth protein 4-like [Branchiostoma belcheri]|uniref:Inhibitor of growth protein n=1 Tax=Branchiostoma belcheri TaxID=7741 RepID=A0A6P4Y270_BRABE|nr:PREDICTED: inhibitor of growth protein 4-like [Branchiostoma belcheri]